MTVNQDSAGDVRDELVAGARIPTASRIMNASDPRGISLATLLQNIAEKFPTAPQTNVLLDVGIEEGDLVVHCFKQPQPGADQIDYRISDGFSSLYNTDQSSEGHDLLFGFSVAAFLAVLRQQIMGIPDERILLFARPREGGIRAFVDDD